MAQTDKTAETKKRPVRKTAERDLAKALYLAGGMNDAEIVAKVGCSVNTLRKWKTDGNWETIKAANTITRPQEVNRLLVQISKINELIEDSEHGIPDAKQVDTISKISAAIEKLDRKDSLVTVVHIMKDFFDYIGNFSDEDVKRLIDWGDKYVNFKASVTR